MSQIANERLVSDLARVEYITKQYRNIQGLKSVVVGFLLLVIAALYEGWVPRVAWVMDSFLVFLLPLCFFGAVAFLFKKIEHYYERIFGHVERSPEQTRRERREGLLVYFLLVGTQFLDRNWQPPVSVWGLTFAALFFIMAWPHRTYQIHYIVTAMLLAGLSLLPLGGISLDSTGTVIGVAAGLMFIFIGIFDHLLLVRTFKPVPGE